VRRHRLCVRCEEFWVLKPCVKIRFPCLLKEELARSFTFAEFGHMSAEVNWNTKYVDNT